jgi:hypothetical protein
MQQSCDLGRRTENLGEAEQSSSRPPWKVRAYRTGKVNDVTYMHVVYICINVLMNYDCTTHPILPFVIQLLQSFFQNIALKGYLTQRQMAITFSILQKNFLTKCGPYKQPKNVKFSLWSIYYWNFPKAREVRKDLKGESVEFIWKTKPQLK